MEQLIEEKVTTWLKGNYDDKTKAVIRNMTEAEKVEAFYKDLEFGTGGLRGIMGVGSNRMNKYTVGAATQGLSNYLNKNFAGQAIKVVVAHDSRNNSPEFASIVADVFSANNIHVYFFESLRPTPELSFAIRHLGCQSGVVLTASHNPKEYNGYKAYWSDGAQLIPPHDKNVITEVRAIASVDDIQFERKTENVEIIGKEMDELYLEQVKTLSINRDVITRQRDLKIVFSPIHGTGIMVPKLLKKMGFENVHIVKEQANPDGNFPTVVYPNPEEEEAMSIALKKAQELNADVIMATDPDADRVGIGVKNHKGKWVLLNGNQTGSLLIGYMLRAWRDAGKITGNQMIIKTIVTSELIDDMAKKFGVKCYNTLTGFKYIADKIRELEGKEKFIAGGEESYGYLIGDAVRDKDAVASCGMIAEMVAYAKDQKQSLFEMLISNYWEYGFYLERLISIRKEGKSGAEEIAKMMQDFRANPPQVINNQKVTRILDYNTSIEKDLLTGKEKVIDLPKSNVLQFYTEDGAKISARPSGTEPKIKFYFSVKTRLVGKDKFDETEALLNQQIDAIITDLKLN